MYRRAYGALGCSSGRCRCFCRQRSGLHCARRCQQGGGRAKFFDLHFLTPHLFCQIVDRMFRLILFILGMLRRMCGTRFNIRNALPNRYFSFAARLRGRSLSFLGSILRLRLLRFIRFLCLFRRHQQTLQFICDRNKCCLALMNIAAVCQHTLRAVSCVSIIFA